MLGLVMLNVSLIVILGIVMKINIKIPDFPELKWP